MLWLEIKPTILVYGDDTLTNWATQFSLTRIHFYKSELCLKDYLQTRKIKYAEANEEKPDEALLLQIWEGQTRPWLRQLFSFIETSDFELRLQVPFNAHWATPPALSPIPKRRTLSQDSPANHRWEKAGKCKSLEFCDFLATQASTFHVQENSRSERKRSSSVLSHSNQTSVGITLLRFTECP